MEKLKLASRPDFENKSVREEEIKNIAKDEPPVEINNEEKLNVENAMKEQKVKDFVNSNSFKPKYDKNTIKAKGPVTPIEKKLDAQAVASMIANNLGITTGNKEYYLVNKVNGERYIIGKTVLIIGSSKKGDVNVPINNKAVSRRHAKIEIADEGAILITDLGSTNGTFLISEDGSINDRMLPNEAYELYPGDTVVFANEEFEIK